MGIRILCVVVVAVVLAALNVPYLPLWIALLGLGMVFLPMIAVMEANDHHPRRRGRHRRLHAHSQHPCSPPAHCPEGAVSRW
jgi:hypothetical protein